MTTTLQRPLRSLLRFWERVATFVFRIPADPFEALWGFAAFGWGLSVYLTPGLFEALPRVYRHVFSPYGEIMLTTGAIGSIFMIAGLAQMGAAFVQERHRDNFDLRVFGRRFRIGPHALKLIAAVATFILWTALSRAFWNSGAITGWWTYGFFALVDALIIIRLKLIQQVRALQAQGLLPTSGVTGTRIAPKQNFSDSYSPTLSL